jgi:transposase
MDISERKRGDRQKLARLIARESNAMQRDRLRSVLLVLQGRRPRLSPEQETRFVQRVKAGATPRDGVASLRGRQIQGILGREFGKTFSLNGVYQLLKRHGFVCLEPRPRHPRQNPAAAKAFKRRAPFVNRVRASRPRTKVRLWFQDEARFGQQGTLTAVWAIKGSRPTVVRQNGRKSIWVFAADEQALVEEAVRSHRTLHRKNIRSICRARWITPED